MKVVLAGVFIRSMSLCPLTKTGILLPSMLKVFWFDSLELSSIA